MLYVSEVYSFFLENLFTISQAGNAARTLTLTEDSTEKNKKKITPKKFY